MHQIIHILDADDLAGGRSQFHASIAASIAEIFRRMIAETAVPVASKDRNILGINSCNWAPLFTAILAAQAGQDPAGLAGPVGSVLSTIWTSIAGASSMRRIW